MVFTIIGVGFQYLDIEQIGERYNCLLTAWWTLINRRVSVGDSLGVGSTTWESALPALGLWKQGIDLIDHWIAFHFEANRGIAEDKAE